MHSWNDGLEGHDEVGVDEKGRAGKASLGSAPMGARVTAQLRHDGRYYAEAEEQPTSRRRFGRGLGAALLGG